MSLFLSKIVTDGCEGLVRRLTMLNSLTESSTRNLEAWNQGVTRKNRAPQIKKLNLNPSRCCLNLSRPVLLFPSSWQAKNLHPAKKPFLKRVKLLQPRKVPRNRKWCQTAPAAKVTTATATVTAQIQTVTAVPPPAVPLPTSPMTTRSSPKRKRRNQNQLPKKWPQPKRRSTLTPRKNLQLLANVVSKSPPRDLHKKISVRHRNMFSR
mmetsp:Transcript_4615/g.8840  ORF Transcript_4615/g.8840 Transcript_4615/m.8840 type:complete len:208 (-) Transcript_4615:346-969(-)